MTIAKGEIYFYNLIKDKCKVIFDVGCRDDIHYIEMSEGKEFHLFEPNLNSFKKLFENLSKSSLGTTNVIVPNNFGLGDKTVEIDYYENSESFFYRPQHYAKTEPVKLKIMSFLQYLYENSIGSIDFLKIDTEGYESDILLDGKDFIKEHVNYVQFEYASTWLDNPNARDIFEIFDVYSTDFNFYFLLDENHPISKTNQDMMTPIIDKSTLELVDNYMRNDYGFNIVMELKF